MLLGRAPGPAGGSLPIAAFTEELGLPCYGVPLANVDEANHPPNENLELDWFLRGIVAAAASSARSPAYDDLRRDPLRLQ